MTIHTGRLLLRPVEEEDYKYLLALHNIPGVKEMILPQQRDPAYIKHVVHASVLHHQGLSGLYFAFIMERAGDAIGTCVLSTENKRRHTGILGWEVHPDHHNNGYATEASHALLDLGFGPCQMQIIRADCFTHNAASRRVMQKLGMQQKKDLLTRLKLYWNYGDSNNKVRHQISKTAWIQQNL